jgi:hypothetical protein
MKSRKANSAAGGPARRGDGTCRRQQRGVRLAGEGEEAGVARQLFQRHRPPRNT